MKAFNFEVYTSNPETGEPGWDIKFVSVFAEDRQSARLALKEYVPHFDCVILFNRELDLTNYEQETAIYASGAHYFYTDGDYNPIDPVEYRRVPPLNEENRREREENWNEHDAIRHEFFD